MSSKVEFGDFQTPDELAAQVCVFLHSRGITPQAIVEPTCGVGNFASAAAFVWKEAKVFGFDINNRYVVQAASRGSGAVFGQADFFAYDWNKLLLTLPRPALILGNPPWVTASVIGTIGGSNLPAKSNFHGRSGFDSISGKANFDISEWMLLQMLKWCEEFGVTVAVLVKVSVARKVIRQAWEKDRAIGGAEIHLIDAKIWFGAAVDACLFIMRREATAPKICPVHDSIGGPITSVLGFRDSELVGDVRRYDKVAHLLGGSPLRWRSGVKHDLAKVMELTCKAGILTNGFGEPVDIESDYLFPMFKSSQLARGDTTTDRFMLVTQRKVGALTLEIQFRAPKTWSYLVRHGELLDARGSTIYKKAPRFAIFGVGDYTFAPFKVAISGLYKEQRFVVLGEIKGKTTVVDDTACILAFDNRIEAEAVACALNSPLAREFFEVFAFTDSKRPYTVELLAKINLAKLVHETGGPELSVLQPAPELWAV